MTGLAAVLAAALLFVYSQAGPLPNNVTMTRTMLPVDECANVQCAPRAGCKALHRPDACCPLYQCECELDGRVYGNGEKLVDPGDPCRVCYCQGGEVVCRRIACFRRDDCRPRAVPGRCCPEYDNCPLTGGSPMIAAVEEASSAATPPPPPPPPETPKQEITIKEITPVSEIPSFSEAKPKEPTSETTTRGPLIVREATVPAQPDPSASPLPTLNSGMSNAYEPVAETSKPTADDDLLDHNPAFPPLPDDLTHRDDDMPEQGAESEPEPASPMPSSVNPPLTTPLELPSPTTQSDPPPFTTSSTTSSPITAGTTAHTALKASPMLNLRAAISTDILNLPSSVHEDINGELDDITEVTTLLAVATSNKEVKIPQTSDSTPNTSVTEDFGTETATISTKHFSSSHTSTSRGSTEYVNTDGVITDRVNTGPPSPGTDRPTTNGVSTERQVTTRAGTDHATTDEPKTDRVITDRPITDRGITDLVSNDGSNTNRVVTDQLTTDQVITARPKADPVSSERPITDRVITDRPKTDPIGTDRLNTDRVTPGPSNIVRAGTKGANINRVSTDRPKSNRISTDQASDQLGVVQTSTNRPSTEKSTTDLIDSDDRSSIVQLGIDSPVSAHDVTVIKTELSSIAVETSDRKPQDTAENGDIDEGKHVSVNPVSDKTLAEIVPSEMTTVFKAVPSNVDEGTTVVVMVGGSAAHAVPKSAAEGAGAGVLGELIDLVGDVAAIGEREPFGHGSEEPQPLNSGYKSRHRPNANSIAEQPTWRRSPELEEDGDVLPEPTPPSRAEPTTRLAPIDGDGARPPAPPPPPAPHDIEIITRSYVPTISRRPTKLVESGPATE